MAAYRQAIKRRGGFTLVELMITIAIIGILAAVAIPNFMNARDRAHLAAAEVTSGSIRQALELYLVDMQSYPASLTVTDMREVNTFLYNPGCLYNFHGTILGFNDAGGGVNGALGDKSGPNAYSAEWEGSNYTFWALAKDRPSRTPLRGTTISIVYIPDGKTSWQMIR